jgi:hypothetical protein
MDYRGNEGIEELDPRITQDVNKIILRDPPPLKGEITFEEMPGGFEVWYSDRIERDHADLVDQSADFLEDELGVLNLGQVDHRMLIADGALTDAVKDRLISWWRKRIEDFDLG